MNVDPPKGSGSATNNKKAGLENSREVDQKDQVDFSQSLRANKDIEPTNRTKKPAECYEQAIHTVASEILKTGKFDEGAAVERVLELAIKQRYEGQSNISHADKVAETVQWVLGDDPHIVEGTLDRLRERLREE